MTSEEKSAGKVKVEFSNIDPKFWIVISDEEDPYCIISYKIETIEAAMKQACEHSGVTGAKCSVLECVGTAKRT